MEPLKYFRFFSWARVCFARRCFSFNASNTLKTIKRKEEFTSKLAAGPHLKDFLANSTPSHEIPPSFEEDPPPYITTSSSLPVNNKVYLETYGCQMNVNDTEIAWSILQKSGYVRTHTVAEADVILLVTCSIREKAEQTIWNRLQQLAVLKRKRCRSIAPLKIGILGCMAERLKEEILQREKLVDVLAGPDAYRDLPRLLAVAETGQQAANVLLSLDETYADIMPIQTSASNVSAFVSIMRGCNNMCTYCIVPFTRGRERSRPVHSILEEVRMLSDQGVKEVTLLGQNVNSYHDNSSVQFSNSGASQLSRGFSTIYKPKKGGLRFVDLLDQVSRIDPEMRIRFTSPHPKDFPDEVLRLISEQHNICKQIHIPAQSGSNRILETMGRGYSREAYLDLIQNIREVIPGISLSSDFIAGFCQETEQDHQESVSLLREVAYNAAFLFAYSMRKGPEKQPYLKDHFGLSDAPVHMTCDSYWHAALGTERDRTGLGVVIFRPSFYLQYSRKFTKTRAYHRLQDDVKPEVKRRRLEELIAVFREEAVRVNQRAVGSTHLVLVEGPSKRSPSELCGRNDGNTKVIFPETPAEGNQSKENKSRIRPGDYVLVKITSSSSQSLRGTLVCQTSLQKSPAYC